ncbi:hypothetical protein CYLTODRAFT_408244 [Cylindrobasidium torrendii FP15055 ss-10]|uniref:Uncharacterized protein n=1 Tax=Cylindrobasidium torrendii FP15055 ss-10 TaxID=1314674 RepID=A0A0D7BLG5_9AGAR|nr:hypothetical protein CYLTODRAFT_408244 [Cylindrobasidium torrendii FP15055 ss-10]
MSWAAVSGVVALIVVYHNIRHNPQDATTDTDHRDVEQEMDDMESGRAQCGGAVREEVDPSLEDNTSQDATNATRNLELNEDTTEVTGGIWPKLKKMVNSPMARSAMKIIYRAVTTVAGVFQILSGVS